MKQKVNKMNLIVLDLFKKYSPMHDKYVTLKNNLMKEENKLLKGFKMKYFHFIMIDKMKNNWNLKKKKLKKKKQ